VRQEIIKELSTSLCAEFLSLSRFSSHTCRPACLVLCHVFDVATHHGRGHVRILYCAGYARRRLSSAMPTILTICSQLLMPWLQSSGFRAMSCAYCARCPPPGCVSSCSLRSHGVGARQRFGKALRAAERDLAQSVGPTSSNCGDRGTDERVAAAWPASSVRHRDGAKPFRALAHGLSLCQIPYAPGLRAAHAALLRADDHALQELIENK
jgi:hypothetical protein